jgi:MFS family permease
MTETIIKSLRDSKAGRWSALILVSIAMVFAYMFIDILAPLQTLFETQLRWTPDIYGKVSGAGYMLNVMGFLILAGIILDRIGVRSSALVAGGLMLVGAAIASYGISATFNNGGFGFEFFSSFWESFPASAKVSLIGFAIFGGGLEMAGITATKAIVKWFKGKELALALAMQVSISRLGTATVFIFAPRWAEVNGISTSIAIGALLLIVSFITFIVYFVMDKKLDIQLGEAEEEEDPFRMADIGKILTSKGFWLVALLCVLYYSAVFPFQKYAVSMLESNLTFRDIPAESFWGSQGAILLGFFVMIGIAVASFSSNFCKKNLKILLLTCSAIMLVAYCYISYMQQSASVIFSVLPLLAIGVTPILGDYIDKKGKAVSMLALGSLLLIICHLTFAFILPKVDGYYTLGIVVAFVTILVLGASFSLVPASLWPIVPKLIDSNVLGSAYALIFWVQNIGLFAVPLLIGRILMASNTAITEQVKSGILTPEQASVMYDYTNPLLMLAAFGVAALILGFVLKREDKVKAYGLELPNLK